MNNVKMTFLEFILWALGILAVVATIVLIFGGAWYTAHQNMNKEMKMTQYCVEHGYRGWDDGGARNSRGDSSCVRD